MHIPKTLAGQPNTAKRTDAAWSIGVSAIAFIGLFNFASSASAVGVPRPGTMTSSMPRRSTSLRRDPQRTVVTLKVATRFAALIRLAVAKTSWVMAALEAMHPSISRTATLVMSKNT